jgi:hypothetical protein
MRAVRQFRGSVVIPGHAARAAAMMTRMVLRSSDGALENGSSSIAAIAAFTTSGGIIFWSITAYLLIRIGYGNMGQVANAGRTGTQRAARKFNNLAIARFLGG